MSDSFDAAAHAAGDETVVPSVPDAAQTPEVQADDAPSASAEDTDAPPSDAPATPSRGEKRVQQLLTERHELRERLAYLEGAQTRAEPAKPAEPAQATLPEDLAKWLGDEPNPDSFAGGEFNSQYLRAIARFEARNEHAQMVGVQRQQAHLQSIEARARSFADEVAKAERENPDLREAVGGLGQRLQNWQANLVADAGINLAYHVAKDTDAEASIRSARTPLAVAREIGRIEARLERSRETPAPQPTTAPDPAPRAVRGGNVGQRDPSRMPMLEYAEWSRKQAPWARGS